ncbi:hypothetical protein NDU88_006105 [Pleurodeles waltl]|uniref:Uncharacterized protein n=1 Tax=Pleurodeles waltl TaxID=8319 RepID=A0AAV7PKK4_PLEWA|nr:hypothetical protein NDU88_006105 [Pleurodeles waltl]
MGREAVAGSGLHCGEEASDAPDRSELPRVSIAGRELLRPPKLRRGIPSSPSAPGGSHGSLKPRETTREESGAAPRGSVIGAPENRRELGTRRTECPRLESGNSRASLEVVRPGDLEVGVIVP